MPPVLEFHELNAFTKKGMAVTGNPAAICLVDEFPSEQEMGEAAKILGAPMTSFVRKTKDPLTYDIRHFSPDGLENHVCGHATLAAAEYLARENPKLRQGQDITFRLNPRYAINTENAFHARIHGDDITLTIPAVTELEEVTDPDFYSLLADALNIAENDIVKPCYYAPRIINYVVALKDEKTLINMKPDFAKLTALAQSEKFPHEGIMATTKSETLPDFDLLTRVFLPVIGVDEDVACGSANCSIIPYWLQHRSEAFNPGKKDFNILFPYPPQLDEQTVGGVQTLHYNIATKEIQLTGQASWHQFHRIDLNPRPAAPKPPAPGF